MSRSVWRIAADTPSYQAHDLSGTGAKICGGRWNAPGLAVIYTSENRALACLETIVHLNSGGLPLNRYLVEITIPDAIWDLAERPTAADLAIGWEAEPPGQVSIAFGSDWLKAGRSALLILPSVIVPDETTILINPEHPDSGTVTAVKRRRWLYDPRVRRSPAQPSGT
ncbi:RES family NAD+ phosphorylase [Acidisoma cellulosilytica]|uniref:RES family NAD+ phosphorylase n=1 Tax=Acidisoma cellulosilyticum TaxID=2802395 RepID=A0A963YYV3_9PROT|nr:RES family NAD+ phosphorylase [Acidisoma cellulosilyticum]MCB8879697.1 RES family NAD+ phosphorylase [Acidisoma cellulosilyticum]